MANTVHEIDDVLVPIKEYMAGHATGDISHFRAAFMPTARIEGWRDGAWTSWTVDEYCERMDIDPAGDEDKRRRVIDNVNIVGTVANVTITLFHGAVDFVDMFILAKMEDGWKITGKVYHQIIH